MDFEKKSEATAFERPKILYHGSSLGDIEIFEPRAKTVRDEKEGPVVFATPDKAYATLFLVESDDSWTQKVNFEGVHTIVISDRERYEKADTGGTIYELPSDSFTNKSKEHDQEWTNPGNVKPVGKTRFPSAIDAMIENGVQVFFTDKETFARIQKSSDYGYSILKTLESENMKRGENVREIVA